jgi:hypothetical protein
MSRSTSPTFNGAVFASETDKTALMLVTLKHSKLSAPLRFVHDGQNRVSRGETYQAAAFDISLPTQQADQPPTARLAICNVDKAIVEEIRGLSEFPTVTIEVILAETPDVVETSYEDMTMKDATYDALIIEGSLGYEDFLMEPYPGDTYTPAIFPGLFGATEEK